MKLAIIGSGISGLSAAYSLSKKYKVDLFEKEDHFGGHSHTIDVNVGDCVYLEVEPCGDETACNFGQPGECYFAEENYDCDGNCIVDVDCAGDCGGDAELDE